MLRICRYLIKWYLQQETSSKWIDLNKTFFLFCIWERFAIPFCTPFGRSFSTWKKKRLCFWFQLFGSKIINKLIGIFYKKLGRIGSTESKNCFFFKNLRIPTVDWGKVKLSKIEKELSVVRVYKKGYEVKFR